MLNLIKNILGAIPFELKLKLRSLGWHQISLENLNHVVYYLNTDFFKLIEAKSGILPDDDLLATQLTYELSTYSPYRHQESVIEITEDTVIEPLMGGVITKKKFIIEECYALPTGQPVALPWMLGAMYKIVHSNIHFERAILLRHPWGDNNYFHFYNDILPKLGLLSDLHLFGDLPIITSRKLYSSSYFQEAIKLANLQDRNWIVQDNEYIKVNNLITIRANELTSKGIFRNLSLLNIDITTIRKNRKIFLIRSPNSARFFCNRSEIINICINLDFEMINCDELTLEAQIDIFANARYIVGEHGAAFSNIIYRYGNSLDVMEIFPPQHISTCYFVISQSLGFNHHTHRCHIGSNESYTVEASEFEQHLKRVISAN